MARGVGKTTVEWAARLAAGNVVPCDSRDTAIHLCEGMPDSTPVYRRVTEWREPKPAQTPKGPRGVCSVCGRERGLNGSGNVRAHDGLTRAPGGRFMEQCDGSRKPPREAVSA